MRGAVFQHCTIVPTKSSVSPLATINRDKFLRIEPNELREECDQFLAELDSYVNPPEPTPVHPQDLEANRMVANRYVSTPQKLAAMKPAEYTEDLTFSQPIGGGKRTKWDQNPD